MGFQSSKLQSTQRSQELGRQCAFVLQPLVTSCIAPMGHWPHFGSPLKNSWVHMLPHQYLLLGFVAWGGGGGWFPFGFSYAVASVPQGHAGAVRKAQLELAP